MTDRDLLRHERLDRVSTFGIENHSNLKNWSNHPSDPKLLS